MSNEYLQDNTNRSYQKLANKNILLLSPYTFWEMQFKSDDANFKFDKILSILNENNSAEIVVSLHGSGQYVTEAYQGKSTDSIDNYYGNFIKNYSKFCYKK